MKNLVFTIAVIVLAAAGTFAQTGGLKGKVRTSDGDSLPGATITVRQVGEDLKSVKTDKSGKFLMEGLKPGKYNVVFSKNGYSTGLMYNIEVASKKTRDLGDRLILTVDQGNLVIINGSAYNQHGFALYGAKVKIEEVFSDGSTKKLDTGYTSRSGEFTFKYPEKVTKYRVTVSAKGAEESKEIEVEEAAIYRVAISLTIK
ncbi:MAG: carboxypeptidase regulatory-like domain-containing protein [Pyrinomonadaceae bacterium]|nr:carboxypeptidase regulatory-like domain-containing protein [Pyrinomonadaceae bacterium]